MSRAALNRWSATLGAAGAAVLLGLTVWSVAIEPRRLRTERHIVRIPHLPACWRGADIALVSDIQVGMPLGNEDVAAEAIRRIVRRRPAAVLLAGDFVLHPGGTEDAAARIALVAGLLRPLGDAGLASFAVLGNHDYQLPADVSRTPPLEAQITDALESAGVIVLRNEVARLDPPHARGAAAPLFLVGLGERRAGDDDARAALDELPPSAPRIVMMHNPDTFPTLPPASAPLAVAGHTHGSQVRLVPGTSAPWWMRFARMPDDLRRGAGWAAPDFGARGNRLYITRGIGFSTAPVRLNAPPELTYFRLYPAA